MSETQSKTDLESIVKIQTFVFFDLETTGLIHGSSMPKITEISLVATSRDSLFSRDHRLPRVLHKLLIPVQPMRLIPLIVSEKTGLYNDLLEHEKPFDHHTFDLLNSFISRLHPPMCFVAHNGKRFDYPIILSELNRIGRTLPENILCIDSLDAFRHFFRHGHSDESKKPVALSVISKDESTTFFDDGIDAKLSAALDTYTVTSTSLGNSMQKLNETTPTHQKSSPMNIKPRKLFKREYGSPAKKRLEFTYGAPANFKLETLYRHFMGADPLNSHSAEDDCLSLLSCVLKIGVSFVSWADRNAGPLIRCAIKK
ncbi:three prime repair exonuclease 2 [Diprion similis]|uniref:three prime repair exonuclease 2 n=1 Tax=Diprion similis TaxID=362088 RepID=UPI001EF7E3EA|nr:three prime repair exonuclease 2 [Diprion similis]